MPGTSRRILITGVSSPTGGRLAQALERDRNVEAIIGVDTKDPMHEFARTEFVRVDMQQGLLRRVLRAAAIDTVLDTRLIADPLLAAPRQARITNVAGTAELVAACANADTAVRKLVLKSSTHYYGCESDAPAFFTEAMSRTHPARTAIERDVVDAEAEALTLAKRRRGTTVTVLRVSDEIASEDRASYIALLNLPVVPAVLGFDPRWQFVHAEDVVGSLAHAARYDLTGIYNVAGDGVLTLSEIVALLGKRLVPVLPPWGAAFAALQLRRVGLRVPVELLRQLRFGRGVDNRRLKATGFAYRYTTREAVVKLRAQQRLRPLLERGEDGYRYEREVEEFLRWSPSVRSAAPPADGMPLHGYDDLAASELIEIISSLDPGDLVTLRLYEAANQARPDVLEALESALMRKQG